MIIRRTSRFSDLTFHIAILPLSCTMAVVAGVYRIGFVDQRADARIDIRDCGELELVQIGVADLLHAPDRISRVCVIEDHMAHKTALLDGHGRKAGIGLNGDPRSDGPERDAPVAFGHGDQRIEHLAQMRRLSLEMRIERDVHAGVPDIGGDETLAAFGARPESARLRRRVFGPLALSGGTRGIES